jgi:hypothetical protein
MTAAAQIHTLSPRFIAPQGRGGTSQDPKGHDPCSTAAIQPPSAGNDRHLASRWDGGRPRTNRARWPGPTAHDPLLALTHAQELDELASRRPFRCPRCGSDQWVPGAPHRGQHAARCRDCLHIYDAEEAPHAG